MFRSIIGEWGPKRVCSKIVDGLLRGVETVQDTVSEAFFEPVIRLGVTGLARSGKSCSSALLLIGGGLFYQSLAKGSVMMRKVGLFVIGAAVAKVFFIDVSGLEGLMRVFSLLVLGLSLAGLAWLNRWAQEQVEPKPE